MEITTNVHLKVEQCLLQAGKGKAKGGRRRLNYGCPNGETKGESSRIPQQSDRIHSNPAHILYTFYTQLHVLKYVFHPINVPNYANKIIISVQGDGNSNYPGLIRIHWTPLSNYQCTNKYVEVKLQPIPEDSRDFAVPERDTIFRALLSDFHGGAEWKGLEEKRLTSSLSRES